MCICDWIVIFIIFLTFNSSLAYLYFPFLIITVSGFCFHLNAQGVMQQNSSTVGHLGG